MADRLTKEDLLNVKVNASVLEEMFGVGDRMIRVLVEQGILEREGRGKYPLMKSVKSYITMIKVSNQAKVVNLDDRDELDFMEEKAKHENAKRQITEIKLQLIRGQVHKSEDVEAVMTDMFAKFRSKIESMPTKLAKRLEGEERLVIQKILQEELAAALEELAAYRPQDFYSDEHIDVSDEVLQDLLENIGNEGQEGSNLQDN